MYLVSAFVLILKSVQKSVLRSVFMSIKQTICFSFRLTRFFLLHPTTSTDKTFTILQKNTYVSQLTSRVDMSYSPSGTSLCQCHRLTMKISQCSARGGGFIIRCEAGATRNPLVSPVSVLPLAPRLSRSRDVVPILKLS